MHQHQSHIRKMKFKTYKNFFFLFGKVQLTSLLLTCLVFFLNRSWQFNPYGWVDQWAYAGIAHFPLSNRSYYPDNPAGDLLPVYLPLKFLDWMMSPLLSKYMLSFIFLYISLFLLLRISMKVTTFQVSLTIAGLFLASQYTLVNSGTTYPSGTVMILLMCCLYFLQFDNSKKPHRHLFRAMCFFWLATYSAILVIVYFPAFLVFYLLNKRLNEGRLRQHFLSFVWASLSSLVVVTLTLQLIYSFYGQGFFFINNIRKLYGFTVQNLYRAPSYSEWLPNATWLIIPTAILFSGVVVCLSNYPTIVNDDKMKKQYSLLVLFLIIFLFLIAINLFIKQWSLQFMYFIQVQGFVYLALIPFVHRLFLKLSKTVSFLVSLFTPTVAVISIAMAESYQFTSDNLRQLINAQFGINLSPMRYSLNLSLFLATLMFIIMAKERLRFVFLTTIVVVSVFSFSPSFGCFSCFNSFARTGAIPGVTSAAVNYSKTFALAEVLNEIDPGRKAKIWFNEQEVLGPFFRQVNSVIYLNEPKNRVNKSYPKIMESGAPIGSEGSSVNSGELVLILSTTNDLITTANQSLFQIGLVGTEIEQTEFAITENQVVRIVLLRISNYSDL